MNKAIFVLIFIHAFFITHAELIEFEFGGEVTSLHGIYQSPWNQVQTGNEWSISYVFESTTPDTFPIDELQERLGSYDKSIKGYELTVGSVTVSDSSDSGIGSIHIYNGYPTGYDQYEVLISLPTEMAIGPWFMQLDDYTDSAWSTDALPLCGDIDLENFKIKDFHILIDDLSGSEIMGVVEYHQCRIVPEPATLSLLVLGSLIMRHRKRSKAFGTTV